MYIYIYICIISLTCQILGCHLRPVNTWCISSPDRLFVSSPWRLRLCQQKGRGWRKKHGIFMVKLLPWKLTCPLKIGINPWKRRFLLETIVFRGYVSFREGSICIYLVRKKHTNTIQKYLRISQVPPWQNKFLLYLWYEIIHLTIGSCTSLTKALWKMHLATEKWILIQNLQSGSIPNYHHRDHFDRGVCLDFFCCFVKDVERASNFHRAELRRGAIRAFLEVLSPSGGSVMENFIHWCSFFHWLTDWLTIWLID